MSVTRSFAVWISFVEARFFSPSAWKVRACRWASASWISSWSMLDCCVSRCCSSDARRRAQGDELRLGLAELPLRVEHLHLLVRVGQDGDDGVRLDDRAGAQRERLDAALRHGRDVEVALGNQRARRAHLPHERAAGHGVDEQRGPVDAGRARLQAAQRERHEQQAGHAGADQDVLLALRSGGAGNVQRSVRYRVVTARGVSESTSAKGSIVPRRGTV
jgi:hypothetical protein